MTKEPKPGYPRTTIPGRSSFVQLVVLVQREGARNQGAPRQNRRARLRRELSHGPRGLESLESLIAPGAREITPPANGLDVPAALEGPPDVAEEAVQELCLSDVAQD